MKVLVPILIALLFIAAPAGGAGPGEGAGGPDYDGRVAALRATAPKGFSVVLERPFVVIGDSPPAEVKRQAEGTVRWAVNLLQKDFFEKPPAEIFNVWLFKDKTSYEANVQAIFHEKPVSPFGYCSHANHALIMDISTGGGTLVHEIVHAFMESNFPECPAWFNEGLASLYEQCREVDGHIRGLTNWRLAGLQKAIRAGTVPSFDKLTAMTATEFYADKSACYSQARYLCYSLQQKGLLVKFFKEFRANVKGDPTGFKTLKSVLGAPDMEAFKTQWEAETLKLAFP